MFAVIETSSRQCMTPPPGQSRPSSLSSPCPTPPNTAPLPKKSLSPMIKELQTLFSSHVSVDSDQQSSSPERRPRPHTRLLTNQQVMNSDSTNQSSVFSRISSSQPITTQHVSSSVAPERNTLTNQRLVFSHVTGRRPITASGCSSLLSSMESVESNTSDGGDSVVSSGVVSSSSGVMSSSLSLETKHQNTRVSND